MKIRIKFEKYGSMKFIGHLDMVRYFQKAMRRADIDICYSEGFSPHQIMSFAAPLGVGLTSSGEYLDIEVNTSRPSREVLPALQQAMVEGIRVVEYKVLPAQAKNAMSLVAAADYLISFQSKIKAMFTTATLKNAVNEFLEGQAEILITKVTKKSERMIDIKPFIYEMKVVEGEEPSIFMKVCTGSTDNLKPELVLAAFWNFCQGHLNDAVEFNPLDFVIHRNEVYAKEGEAFIPLGELGQDII